MKDEKESGTKFECPKCGNLQQNAEACSRCGLVFSRFDPKTLPPDPPKAAELWAKLEASPRDEQLQEDFLQAALAARRLDYATRMLRRLERAAEAKEAAQRMQRRLLELAQATLPLGVMKPRERSGGSGRRLWPWIAAAAVLGLLCWILYHFNRYSP